MSAVGTLLRTAAGLAFPRLCAGCDRAGLPLLCPDCAATARRAEFRELAGIEFTASAFLHEAAPRAALLAAKLGGERRGCPDLARWFPPPPDGSDTVTSVPDTYERRVQRGGSVTEAMARAFARTHQLRYQRLLVRRKKGIDLGGASRKERAAVAEGVFAARGPSIGRIILIDDVITTGSTAMACARALRTAGAEAVTFLSFTSAELE